MATISLCMIVRNEERFLPSCLESMKGLVDEMIIVDTGSSDKTVEIAESFGAKVLHYVWNDDGAGARNAGLKEATCDWILIIDADETISSDKFSKLKELVESNEFDAYYLVQVNYYDDTSDVRFVALPNNVPEAKGAKGYFPVEIVRLFRNRMGVIFTSIVHERLNESVKENGLRLARTDFPINHYQYLKGEEEMKRKQLAFLRVFEKKILEYPNDAKMHHDMAIIYQHFTPQKEKALEFFLRAVELKPGYFEPLFSLAVIYERAGEVQKALEYYQKAIVAQPSNAAVYYNIGNLFVKLKQVEKAEEAFAESVRLNPNNAFAQNNLGNILVMQKKLAEGLSCFKKAVELQHPRSAELKQLISKIEEDLK